MEHDVLTPLSMHLLLALAETDLHGYALMQAVREQSGDTVRPGTGSLYAALQRLLDDGLIEIAQPDEATSGRRGNTYSLTESGARAVVAEAERMRGVLALVAKHELAPDPDTA